MIAKLMKLFGMALVAGLFANGTAVAQNPHFIRANVEITNTGDLLCSWKETGLGTNELITYTCGAEAVAVLERCFTRSGNQPQAANKVTVETNVEVSDTFPSGKNGQITASLTAAAPEAESFCPPGQVQRTVAVRWCNAFLEDSTNNIVGATATELHRELIAGAGSVPPCSELVP